MPFGGHGFHIDDWGSIAWNLHLPWGGPFSGPIVWIFLDPKNSQKLVSLLGQQAFVDAKTCCNLGWLKQNKIKFQVAVVEPGDLIITGWGWAHSLYNLGTCWNLSCNTIPLSHNFLNKFLKEIGKPHPREVTPINQMLWGYTRLLYNNHFSPTETIALKESLKPFLVESMQQIDMVLNNFKKKRVVFPGKNGCTGLEFHLFGGQLEEPNVATICTNCERTLDLCGMCFDDQNMSWQLLQEEGQICLECYLGHSKKKQQRKDWTVVFTVDVPELKTIFSSLYPKTFVRYIPQGPKERAHWKIPQTKIKVTQSTKVIGGNEAVLMHYVPGLLNESELDVLTKSSANLVKLLKPKKQNNRKGNRIEIGHWRIYAGQIRACIQNKLDPVLDWVTKNKGLFEHLSSWFKTNYSGLTDIYEDYIAAEFRMFGLWSLAFLNVDSPSSAPHVDGKDWKIGLSVITAFGRYTGGALFCPEIGFEIPLSEGDVVFLNTYALSHQVLGWKGNRTSLVITTHGTQFYLP